MALGRAQPRSGAVTRAPPVRPRAAPADTWRRPAIARRARHRSGAVTPMSIPSNHPARNWRRVTRSHPCPVCGRPDWCSLSADGTVARCMRVAEGACRTGTQRDGATYYLHRLGGAAAAPPPPLPPPGGHAPDRADPDTLHAVYGALL